MGIADKSGAASNECINVLSLAVTDILDDRPRVAIYNEPSAKELGESILAYGQHTPILVQALGSDAGLPWRLIAGQHRLRGCQLVGIGTIRAIVAAGPDATESELLRLEVSENMDRRSLHPLDRAKFLHARARLALIVQFGEKADEPSHVRAGRARHKCGEKSAINGINSDSYSATAMIAVADPTLESWDQLIASEAGISVRTSRMYRALYSDIIALFPDSISMLNVHPLGESLSALTRLTQLKLPDRAKVIATIVADDGHRLSTIDAAISTAGVRASRGARNPDRIIQAIENMKKDDLRAYGTRIIERATAGVRRDLAISAIINLPGCRAELIAAAMDGLTTQERLALWTVADRVKLDLSEYHSISGSKARG